MPSCDMCGKETSLVTADVEGVEMRVCSPCSKFGTVKAESTMLQFQPKKIHKDPALRVISNYASVVRQTREKRNLSQEDFARFLQERESIVAKWEQGKMQPSVEVARRLEKLLGISLIEDDADVFFTKKKTFSNSQAFTLGDFIKVRKKP